MSPNSRCTAPLHPNDIHECGPGSPPGIGGIFRRNVQNEGRSGDSCNWRCTSQISRSGPQMVRVPKGWLGDQIHKWVGEVAGPRSTPEARARPRPHIPRPQNGECGFVNERNRQKSTTGSKQSNRTRHTREGGGGRASGADLVALGALLFWLSVAGLGGRAGTRGRPGTPTSPTIFALSEPEAGVSASFILA